jgi:hypothetical protein
LTVKVERSSSAPATVDGDGLGNDTRRSSFKGCWIDTDDDCKRLWLPCSLAYCRF